jgi:hypothetical protein
VSVPPEGGGRRADSPAGSAGTEPGNSDAAAGLGADTGLNAAVLVALEALEERAATSRWTLEDPMIYGIIDPDAVRLSLERDEGAGAVLRAALDLPGRAAAHPARRDTTRD